jgi:hypothetical protein
MAEKSKTGISFDLSDEERRAIETLAGNRQVRLSGRVVNGTLRVDFVACNAAFVACNAAFNACNAAFNACNAAFSETKKR